MTFMDTLFDQKWIENRKQHRKRLTGKKQIIDNETGYMEMKDKKGFNASSKKLFIETLKKGINTRAICEVVGVDRAAVYDAIALDPLFRQHYSEIMEGHTDDVEQMLLENAKNNKMSSAERIFWLKKRRPHIYADKIEIKSQDDSKDALLKALAGKFADYQIIPKADVIDTKQIKDDKKEG